MVCASCRIHSPASSEDGANRVVGMVIQVSFPASMASMGVVNSGYHRECSAAGINETSRMTLIRRIASNKHRSNESIRLCDLPRCHLASVVGPSTMHVYVYIYMYIPTEDTFLFFSWHLSISSCFLSGNEKERLGG